MRLAFSSLACPGWSVEDIAGAADRHGYEGVEWRLADGALLDPRTDEAVWERIAASGVEHTCLDTSCVFVRATEDKRSRTVEDAIAMGERAASIGASSIRVFGGGIPDGSSREELIAPTREALATAAAGMPADVRILVETHDAWSKGPDVSRLVTDGVGVLWDIAHTVRAGESVGETIEAIGVPGLVHIKDARGETLTHLGEGDVPLANAIDALRSVGYDGWISLEWEKLWHPELDDPDVVLPRAKEFLTELLP